MRHYLAALPCAAAICSIASLGEAHISLDAPVSRYYLASSNEADQTKLKEGPCGVSGDKRTTTASLITTYKPGESITVTWRETVQHPGHYRIAFDSDGQDFAMPGVASPSGVVILADNIADKSTANYSQQVTLPAIECANCTLQLIQVMTTNPPPYAATGDLYFNCADIVLKGAGGSTGTGGTSAGAGGATTSQGGRSTAIGGTSARASTGTGGASVVSAIGGNPGLGGSSAGTGGSPSGGTIGVGGASTIVSSSGKGGINATGGMSASGGSLTTAAGGSSTGGLSHGNGLGGSTIAEPGIGGAAPAGGAASVSGGTMSSAASPAAGATIASTDSRNDSGCGCRMSSRSSSRSLVGLGIVGVLLTLRRRRR